MRVLPKLEYCPACQKRSLRVRTFPDGSKIHDCVQAICAYLQAWKPTERKAVTTDEPI